MGKAFGHRSWLLLCGILSSLLYLTADLVAAWSWDDYRYSAQTISELSAIGAPTRPAWLVFALIYNPLLLAFARGAYACAGRRESLRVTARLVAGIAAVGLVWPLFFPMHARGAPTSLTDTMHVALAAVTVVLTLFAMGFSAAALGRGFRVFTIVTMVVLLAAGALAGLDGPRVAVGLPTPGLGLLERLNVYGYLLWVLLLAVVLWREQRRARPALAAGLAPEMHTRGA